ncbi:MAG: hypothetical protein GJ678_07805 [Rhodobacteraceae bacterium]|nr:hypothetical protein [Paracoccaceae bacterium]
MGVSAFCPASAWAEVCDKERPSWDPASGPATALDELIGLSTLPITIALFALAIFALISRSRFLKALSGFLWGGLALIVSLDAYGPIVDDVRYYAIKEGCIGPPHLFIALAIAICAVMTYGALRPRT